MGWLAIPPASKAAISPIVLLRALPAGSITGRLLGFAVTTASDSDRSAEPAGVLSAQDALRHVGELVVRLAIRRRATLNRFRPDANCVQLQSQYGVVARIRGHVNNTSACIGSEAAGQAEVITGISTAALAIVGFFVDVGDAPTPVYAFPLPRYG